MSAIPIYLKSDAAMPRPKDSEFYWVTQSGIFFCRNHPFFASDTPAQRPPRALAEHQPACEVQYPKLGRTALEQVIGFFHRVFDLHCSEAVILLLWDLERHRYRLCAPEQKARVWESRGGIRTPMDITYKVPVPLPKHHLLVGDIHSHGDLDAYSSYTDRHDELYRDGVHVIVGKVQEDPPAFHQEFVVDGHRFPLEFDHLFGGYEQRRDGFPERWLDRVSVKVQRYGSYWGWNSKHDCGYHGG